MLRCAIILSILDVIVNIIQAFQAIMNEEWEIPLFRELRYELFTGDKLTFSWPNQPGWVTSSVFQRRILQVGEGRARCLTHTKLKEFKEPSPRLGWHSNQGSRHNARQLRASRCRASWAPINRHCSIYHFRTFGATSIVARLADWIRPRQPSTTSPGRAGRGLTSACVGLRFLTTGSARPGSASMPEVSWLPCKGVQHT